MMTSWRYYFCLIFLSLTAMALPAQAQTPVIDTLPFTSVQEEHRYQSLIQEIRCVVCQGQSIADSNALLANDMRVKVYHMVQDKKSDAEIKDYLAKRYGEFILLQPRFSSLTLLLWSFPFLGIVVALLMVFYQRRRGNAPIIPESSCHPREGGDPY